MQSQIHTQEDLKSLLQKVISDRQGGNPIAAPKPTVVVPPEEPKVEPPQKEPEVVAVINTPTPEPKQDAPPKESQSHKRAIKELQVKLTEKTQELALAKQSIDDIIKENERQKEAIRDMSRALQETRTELQGARAELDLQKEAETNSFDVKQRLLRLIADKKELEDKVTAITCEKATLSARLQTLLQKTKASLDQEATLDSQVKGLTVALREMQNELEMSQTASHDFQKKNLELINEFEKVQTDLQNTKAHAQSFQVQVQELEEQLETCEKNHSQELSVSQACLLERSQALEEEQRKHKLLAQEHHFIQKRVEEQENHLRLLEQHLARRVKECALLSKQLEEQMDRFSTLQNSLQLSEQSCSELRHMQEQAKKRESSLRIEMQAQETSLQAKIDSLQDACNQLQNEVHDKDAKLSELFKQQAQLVAIKDLIVRAQGLFENEQQAAIVLPVSPTNAESGQVKKQVEEKDFFSLPIPSKPPQKSLFE